MDSHKTDGLRQPWYPSRSSSNRLRRNSIRLLMTAWGLGLLILLGYLSLSPFWHPNTFWASVSEVEYSPESGLPLGAGFPDRGPGNGEVAASAYGQFKLDEIPSASSMADFLKDLQSYGFEKSDSLIIYIRARGMVIQDDPVLVCRDFNVADRRRGTFPIDELFRRIGDLRAAVKLVVLETDDQMCDARLGQSPGRFVSQVKKALIERGRDDIWVITSHNDWQHTQGSTALNESIFKFWFDRGIAGHADADQNLSVDIGELYRYVEKNVETTSSLRSNGMFTQQPQLFYHGDVGSLTSYPQLVSTARLVRSDPANDLSNELKRRRFALETDSSIESNKTPLADTKVSNPPSPQTAQNAEPKVSQDAESNVSQDTESNVSQDTESNVSQDIVEKQDSDVKADATGQPKELSTALRIAECWSVVKQLDQGIYPRPTDLAPSLWHSVQESLFWYDVNLSRTASGVIRKETESAVQNLHFALTRLAAGEIVPKSLDTRLSRLSELGIAGNRRIAMPLRELIDKKDLSIRGWVLDNPQSGQETDSALVLLYQLTHESEIDELVIRDAVSVRLAADNLLSFQDIFYSKLRERFLDASRQRILAERQLIDRTRADWRQFSLHVLADVRKQYDAILFDLQSIADARRMQSELLATLPAYLQLKFWFTADKRMNFLSHAEMMRLVDRLEQLGKAISDQDLQKLGNLVRELTPIHSRVLADPDIFADAAINAIPPNLAALELFAMSPAVSYEKRCKVNIAMDKADRLFWEGFDTRPAKLPTSPSDAVQQFQDCMRSQEEINLHLFHLKTRGLEISSTTYDQSNEPGRSDSDFLRTTVDGFESAVSAINRSIEQRRDLRDPARYATTKLLLDGCVRAVGMMDPRDLSQVNTDAIFEYKNLTDAYGRMRLQYDELRRSQWDASDIESLRIKRIVSLTRNKLNVSQGGPPVDIDNQQSVSISGPESLSLESLTESTLSISLRSFSQSPQPAWVLLEFDESLFEVQSSSGIQALSVWPLLQTLQSMRTQAELKLRWAQSKGLTHDQIGEEQRLLDQLDDAINYPANPSVAGLAPTLMLGGDTVETFTLNVRRKKAFGRQAKLIVKVVTAGSYDRHEINVILPSVPTIKMTALGHPSLITVVPDGVLLHPFPNRETPLELAIINDQGAAKTLNLKLLSLKKAIDFELPLGSVSGERAVDVLQSLEPTDIVAERRGVTILPGQSNSLAKLLASQSPVVDSAQTAETAVSGNSDSANTEKSISFVSDFGSVLVVDDPITGDSIFLRIAIAVQRPRRYIQPSVDYNSQTRKLDINFEAIVEDISPVTGVPINANVLPAGLSDPTRLSGVLVGPDYRATLFSIVPSSSPWVDINVDVDGYPRAFAYRIPCHESIQNHQKQVDQFGIRISSPSKIASYRAPVDTIEVLLQVDSPLDTFPLYSVGRDYIEIGLDFDRDRFFRNEQTKSLVSDRSVKVQTRLDGPFFVVDAKVSDFLIDIPTYRISDVRANVLARLVSGDRQLWSNPIEIMLDGTGPTITKVELSPDRSVSVDGVMGVRAMADDRGLSGVAKVEFLVDSTQTGMFLETSKPIEATQDDLFRWIAEVSFKDLRPGSYDILTRATDKLGNVGPVLSTPVTLLNKPDDPSVEQSNIVSGIIMYDRAPLAFANVTLTPIPAADPNAGDSVSALPVPSAIPPAITTNASGHFIFPQVPPGSYSIRVVGLARNKTRIAEQQIVVKAKPEKPIRLELNAK